MTVERRKNEKQLKKLVVSSAAVVLAFSSVMSVSTETLKDCFNAEYYSSTYADLDDAFGNGEDALYKYYLEYGIAEGRMISEPVAVQSNNASTDTSDSSSNSGTDADDSTADNNDASTDDTSTDDNVAMKQNGLTIYIIVYCRMLMLL